MHACAQHKIAVTGLRPAAAVDRSCVHTRAAGTSELQPGGPQCATCRPCCSSQVAISCSVAAAAGTGFFTISTRCGPSCGAGHATHVQMAAEARAGGVSGASTHSHMTPLAATRAPSCRRCWHDATAAAAAAAVGRPCTFSHTTWARRRRRSAALSEKRTVAPCTSPRSLSQSVRQPASPSPSSAKCTEHVAASV